MTALRDNAEQIRIRMLADSFREARATNWEARAEMLEWARPRPDDFHGNATAEELAERDEHLAHLAETCRQHAKLLREVV